MVNPRAIDRDELHRHLYAKADRLGRLQINLTALAQELGLGYCNLSVVIGQMVTTGRLRHLSGAKNKRKTYVVADPDVYVP